MAKTTTSFVKGQIANPKGRGKGTKNRSTEEIRLFIQRVVSENLENLEEDLRNMNPTNRWVIIDKVTKYFMPALTKNDNINEHSGEIKILVEYSDSPKDKTDETKDNE